MVEILIVAYLIFSLPVAMLIWASLVASKHGDNKSQEMKHNSLAHRRFSDLETKPINSQPS